MRILVLICFFIDSLLPRIAMARDWQAEKFDASQIEQWLSGYQALPDYYEPSLGIELEGRYPYPMDNNFSILGITTADILQNQNVDSQSLQIKENQSTILYKLNGFDFKLEFKIDPTIVPISSYQNFEMNSPVLRTKQDRAFFAKLLRELSSKVDLTAAPASAGLHLHIGFENPSLEEVALFTFLASSVHTQLRTTYLTNAAREESYAKAYSESEFKWFLGFLYSNRAYLNERLGHKTMIASRSRAINWQAFPKFKTVEIRFLNSSFNPLVIQSASDFFLKLTKAIRTKSEALTEYLRSTKPNDIELVGLAKAIHAELADPALRRRVRLISQLELENEYSRLAGIEVKNEVLACDSILLY